MIRKIKYILLKSKITKSISDMTECPNCKLTMESHSASELMVCCMKQAEDGLLEDLSNCPNCKHRIEKHTNQELAECTLEFLKSGIDSFKIELNNQEKTSNY